jgi:hypothetical protein
MRRSSSAGKTGLRVSYARGGRRAGGTIMMAVIIWAFAAAACAGSARQPHARSAVAVTQKAGGEAVILFPLLGAGEGGWCLSRVMAAGVECPTYALSPRQGPFAGPIVVESWSGSSSGSSVPVRSALVLTTSEVATISLEDGTPIATRAQPSLPDHMRSALVELVGGSGRRVLGVEEVPPLPGVRFAALNARGERLPEGDASAPALQFHGPARTWRGSHDPARGMCELHARGLAPLIATGGAVMTAPTSHKDVRGREFVDCIERTYRLNGWPIQADLLVDAEHLGMAPAPLPAMQPLPGTGRGGTILQGPGTGGHLVARRVSGAWLVVTKGRDVGQRIAVLKQLRAAIGQFASRS